ncbi:MAG: isoprenylcysteine carboxylmethyltransferase family protein [Brevinematales bacterium]|jgi:protein-S-isoprenylcysteine O-methyltransferase
MSLIYIIADVILLSFFIIERLLRQGAESKSMEKTSQDRGSTNLIALAMVVSSILVFISPALNYYRSGWTGWPLTVSLAGILMMVAGLSVRIIAALTLGGYYTRVLRKTKNHRIISSGIYKYVRNPGYLGVISLLAGGGIASGNIFCIFTILAIVPISYIYRIGAEEKMMLESFGDEYREYMKKTKRLLPFIY